MAIAFAKLMLRNSATPIAKIARCAGFCTPSHLANAFRAATGVSPRRYRSGDYPFFFSKSLMKATSASTPSIGNAL